jgi:hypothetical protein
MKNFLTKPTWNPYLAGALAGLLAISSVVASAEILSKPKYLGASTTFVRAAGLIEQQVASEHVKNNEYFQSKKVNIDWQMMVVVGIFMGSLLSSLLGRTYKKESVPAIWKERFGNKPFARAIGAFIGGIILIFGVRLASGCPSGHGLSGIMQLAVSGFIAMIFFMVGGIITAKLLYRGK